MAKSQELPGFTLKRKVLFGAKTPKPRLVEVGKQFMDAGRYDDALEFFRRAEDTSMAERIADLAIQQGNVPLMMRARRVSGADTPETQWLGVAINAEKAGISSGAKLAYERAGRPEDAERVAALIPNVVEKPDGAVALPSAVDEEDESEQ